MALSGDRCCSIDTILISRASQTQILAQSMTLILASEEAATTQFRYYQFNKIVQTTRQIRRHDIKTIGSVVDEPFFQLIGDLYRGTPDGTMTTSARHSQIKLANGQVLSTRQILHQF